MKTIWPCSHIRKYVREQIKVQQNNHKYDTLQKKWLNYAYIEINLNVKDGLVNGYYLHF